MLVSEQGIPEGQYTQIVYTALKEERYHDAIRILSIELQNFPRSRAITSLLAYSYYHIQNFTQAQLMYMQLTKICPHVEEYKVYYAQSLYKAGMYQEAMRAAARVDNPQYTQKMLHLQALIKYALDETRSCKTLLDQCLQDDPHVMINYAAISFKEANYEEAQIKYTEALNSLGYHPDLAYNIALCYYMQKNFDLASKYVNQIIEKGRVEHPELSIGSITDGIDVRSVGNCRILLETFLIEAFNLRCAIEYNRKNMPASKIALSDMPPRLEHELDPVTLHNVALINMDKNPNDGFRKLSFLLAHPPFPPETFANLLLLRCQYQHYDLAADILAENSHLTFNNKLLSQDLYEYLDACINILTSPEEAYRKFDDLTNKHIDNLRRLTKNIQDINLTKDSSNFSERLREAMNAYDAGLEDYIPVLMQMARIYWDRDNYPAVEALLRQSAEFCSEHETWKLNVAHVFFMQENQWKFAIQYYAPIVEKNKKDILKVPAIVLANLCVAYIMTSQNSDAEELMRKIEKEEEKQAKQGYLFTDQQYLMGAGLDFDSSDLNNSTTHAQQQYKNNKQSHYHLCIVNLVIGTLYCAKGNFEFGISRIIKSLEPYDKKIDRDTWYYAKRCFLALAENIAKQMQSNLKDESLREIIEFFEAVELIGKNIELGNTQGSTLTATPTTTLSTTNNNSQDGTGKGSLLGATTIATADGNKTTQNRSGSTTVVNDENLEIINDDETNNVAWEARQLRALYLKIVGV